MRPDEFQSAPATAAGGRALAAARGAGARARAAGDLDGLVAAVDRLPRRRLAQHLEQGDHGRRGDASTRSTPSSRPRTRAVVAFGADVAGRSHDTAALRDLAAADPADRTRVAGASRRHRSRTGAAAGARGAAARPRAAHRAVLRRTRDDRRRARRGARIWPPTASRCSSSRWRRAILGDTWVDRDRRCPIGCRPARSSRRRSTSAASAQAPAHGRAPRSAREVAGDKPRRAARRAASTPVPLDVTFAARRRRSARGRSSRCPAIRWRANNTLAREVVGAARGRTCSTSRARRPARSICRARSTQSGFDVTVARRRRRCRSTAAELEPWDVVILSDVRARAISDAVDDRARRSGSSSDGGGLLVAGGESVFGEGSDRRRDRAIATPSSSG